MKFLREFTANDNATPIQLANIRRYGLFLALMWSLLVVLLLLSSVYRERQLTEEAASREGHIYSDKDQAFRFWAAAHGGVYVPVDENTPPNPYLAHLPERDIETPSGVQLTLMNPAYMIRQLNEEYAEQYGITGHITSLELMRPKNAPDEWERAALLAFEEGVAEVGEFTEIDGQLSYRLMHPMIVTEGCLKCHSHQGYEVGDVRGGVSITLPMDDLLARERHTLFNEFLAIGTLWILGLVSVSLVGWRLDQSTQRQALAQDALRYSESRYRQMFETNQAIKLIVDPQDGRIVEANKAASLFYGYDGETLASMKISDINTLSSDEVSRELERAKTKDSLYFSFRHRLASGEIRDVEVYSGPLNTTNGLRLYSIIHDVTQRKQAEVSLYQLNMELEQRVLDRTNDLSDAMSDLMQAKDAAEAANRTKSAFLANMSHELRTPLNIILAYTQLMRRNKAKFPNSQTNLQTIEESGVNLREMINELLEISKIEAGHITLNESEFDLHQQLLNLETMFALPVQNKGLSLHFDIASNLPRYIYADERKLRQIILDLLSNAIKFTEEGGIIVEAKLKKGADGSSGSFCVLQFLISDTGVGIAPDEMEDLFTPFAQTASGSRSQVGTGLGLPISRAHAQSMGGDIAVQSVLGKGTKFVVEMKATAVSSPTDAGFLVQKAQQSYKNVIGLLPGQSEIRVLVADDNKISRIVLEELLAEIGFVTRGVENGEEAVAEWATWQPHLIWMDKRMPIMDGREAAKRIKNAHGGQETVIIELTGSAIAGNGRIHETSDYDDFLSKPFQMAELFEKMAQHLDIKYSYRESTHEEPPPDIQLTPNDLQRFPDRWRAAFHEAAAQGRAERALELIDEIRMTHPEIGDALTTLVDDFRFEEIVTLTRVL